jgi:hypothetical protein
VHKQRLKLTTDASAMKEESKLDGCYVVESDLMCAAA